MEFPQFMSKFGSTKLPNYKSEIELSKNDFFKWALPGLFFVYYFQTIKSYNNKVFPMLGALYSKILYRDWVFQGI